jgi:hypothetical protein
MREAGFYQRVRKRILAAFPLARIDRIESSLSSGIPDVSACIAGRDLWIELKFVESWPARATTRVLSRYGLNAEQINWHIREHVAGGMSFIMVGVGRESLVVDGERVREINDWTRADWEQHAITLDEFIKQLQKA